MKKILAIIISNREKYFSVDKNCELVHGPFIFPFLFICTMRFYGLLNTQNSDFFFAVSVCKNNPDLNGN